MEEEKRLYRLTTGSVQMDLPNDKVGINEAIDAWNISTEVLPQSERRLQNPSA